MVGHADGVGARMRDRHTCGARGSLLIGKFNLVVTIIALLHVGFLGSLNDTRSVASSLSDSLRSLLEVLTCLLE